MSQAALPWSSNDTAHWNALMDQGAQAHAIADFGASHRWFLTARKLAEKGLQKACNCAHPSAMSEASVATVRHYAAAATNVARNGRCWGRFELCRSALEEGVEQLLPLMENERLPQAFRCACRQHAQCLTRQLACHLNRGGASEPAMRALLEPIIHRIDATAGLAPVPERPQNERLH
ncbi:MAG: hypothetical protein AAGH19_08075 [Pseudomonadota bacterium]